MSPAGYFQNSHAVMDQRFNFTWKVSSVPSGFHINAKGDQQGSDSLEGRDGNQQLNDWDQSGTHPHYFH